MNQFLKLLVTLCISLLSLPAMAQDWVEHDVTQYNCNLVDVLIDEHGDEAFSMEGDELITLSAFLADIATVCEEFRESNITPTPRKAAFIGIYGDSGRFDFCVMSSRLNVRTSPSGSVTDSMDKGTVFTVDLGSKVKSGGYVWAEHDMGWSALYPLNNTDRVTTLTHPENCPQPALTPTVAKVAISTPRVDLQSLLNSELDSVVDNVTVTRSTLNVLVQTTLLHGDSDTLAEAAIRDIGRSICLLKNNGYRSYKLTYMGSHPSDSEPFSIKFRSQAGTTSSFRCPVGQLSVESLLERLEPITEFSDVSEWLMNMAALGM